MPELVVASFNVHAGVDGWGRPFDVVAACSELNADVLFLQENWIPENSEGLASMVASSLGYEVHEAPLSGAILFEPPTPTGGRWGPSARHRSSASPLWVTDAQTLSRVRRQRPQAGERLGSWGIAVLSRLAMERVEAVELGRLAKDRDLAEGLGQGPQRAAQMGVAPPEPGRRSARSRAGRGRLCAPGAMRTEHRCGLCTFRRLWSPPGTRRWRRPGARAWPDSKKPRRP